MTKEQENKFNEVMLMLGGAHDMLARTKLETKDYQPVSSLLAKAKVKLLNLYTELKSTPIND